MKFQLLSRAAVAALAAGGVAASGDDKDAGPAPGQGGSDKPVEPAPAEPGDKPAEPQTPASDAEAPQQVVAAADAQALIAQADAAGFARANARMTTVFASEQGKANPSLAAFMLANSTAEATAIVDQLKAQGGAAAPAAAAAAPAADAKPAIPDTTVDIGVDPVALAGGDGAEAKTADAGWDSAIAAHSKAAEPLIPAQTNAQGHIVVPAIPKTGN